jgi:murein L,D-transpeptidase YafK
MTVTRRSVIAGGAALALSACGQRDKFLAYDGPEVTRVQVYKGERRMYLFHGKEVLEAYRVHLGFTAEGPKRFRGDGRTPEGSYRIDRRNPNSKFHLSLGISYPDADDIAFAIAHGRHPGGDIFIHGDRRPGVDPPGKDWTAGCIALRNRQIEQVYAMVPLDTPIDIFA